MNVHGNDEARRCALPGCDAVIAATPGRSERRYCTPAHRTGARQARRAAMQARRAEADLLSGSGAQPWPGGSAESGIDRYPADLTVGSPSGRHRAGAERPEHRPITAPAGDDLDDEEIEERNAAGSDATSPCAVRHPGGPDEYIRFSRSLVGA
jgi:hypothetical protein